MCLATMESAGVLLQMLKRAPPRAMPIKVHYLREQDGPFAMTTPACVMRLAWLQMGCLAQVWDRMDCRTHANVGIISAQQVKFVLQIAARAKKTHVKRRNVQVNAYSHSRMAQGNADPVLWLRQLEKERISAQTDQRVSITCAQMGTSASTTARRMPKACTRGKKKQARLIVKV
jgi:hypothetical protein